MNIGFPQFSVPPTDPKTGQWNRVWYLFLQDLWTRTGGSGGQTINEIIEDLPDDAGLEELKADFFSVRDALSQAPPNIPTIATDDQAPPGAFFSTEEFTREARIQALEAMVSSLINEINAIKQGLVT